MVVYFGMSEKLPNLNYYDSSGQDWGFTKPYSEETSRMIDQEVQRIITEQYERAKKSCPTTQKDITNWRKSCSNAK